MKPSRVRSTSDLLSLLDELVSASDDGKWTEFYLDREKNCPFFVNKPDRVLVELVQQRALPGRKALDVGCGAGRNSVFLAREGFEVDGIDISPSALAWARERVAEAGLPVRLLEGSVLDPPDSLVPASYDLIHDTGCFHHLPPHRRESFRSVIHRLLKPDGLFSLICFKPEGGSGLTDLEVYSQGTLKGGLGYTVAELTHTFDPDFRLVSCQGVSNEPEESPAFGRDFLWSLLFEPLAAD